MSVNPTSIQSGFARSRSEALFPRLFPDVGWWCPSLNPPGGSRLHDLSGRQNWGTLTNMANDDWVVSGGRGALDFDGTNDYCLLHPSKLSTFTGLGLFTVSLWIYPRNVTTRNMAFGDFNSGGTGLNLNVDLNTFASNRIGLRSGNNQLELTTASVANRWYFVVASKIASINVAGYLDGNYIGSLTYIQTTTGDGTVSIGRSGAYNSNYFNGQIDDVRIWSRALSASEVRQLYQLGRGNMPRIRQRRYTEEVAGFKAYWANRRSRIIGAGI